MFKDINKFNDSHNSLLKTLARNSFKAIDNGSYEINHKIDYYNHSCINIKKKIMESKQIPIITEIKYSSPSRGNLIDPSKVNIADIVSTMESAGSCGISILTQPYLFNGSINYIIQVRKKTTLPILMKDIIVSDVQINAAKKIGADCILLIKTVFDKNLAESSIERLCEYAKKIGLHVIVESHFEEEFREVIDMNRKSGKLVDIIGINNRNLDTMKIDLEITKEILKRNSKNGNVVISESGICSKEDIMSLLKTGADGFLVGTSLIQDIHKLKTKLTELIFMK